MLVTQQSRKSPAEGTIGGGKLELAAIDYAKNLLADKDANKTEVVSWNLQSDVKMTCGGVVQLYFEVVQHEQWNIAVFGAGHVSQALIPVLLSLSCHVWCIDSRQEWLDKLSDSASLTKILAEDISKSVSDLPEDAYIVSVTQGHAVDVQVAIKVFESRVPPFIGIIGSKSKSAAIKKDLKAAGVSEEYIQSIHCPLGLPIGGDIPSEIAISIAGQLLQKRT